MDNSRKFEGLDNAYAQAYMDGGVYPGYLTSTGFGFSIPDGSIINGVEVSVERYQKSRQAGGYFYDYRACLIVGGTRNDSTNKVTNNYILWAETEETKIFGGPTDLWGLNLTPADINNPGFGFDLQPRKTAYKASAFVDSIRIKVYYTPPLVIDINAPLITLNGADPINLFVGDTYTEPGATWTDAVDGTGDAIVSGDTVNTGVAGTYTVRYNKTDTAGNAAAEVTRTVNVQATAPAPSTGGGSGTTTTAATSTISVLGIVEGGSSTDFVTERLYRSILLRESDAAGLAGWVNALANEGLTGEDAAKGFVYSAELKQYLTSLDNTGYLNFLYNRVFGRAADLPGLNGWLSNMSSGMTREEVLNYFLNSEEWYAICNPYGVTP